jgi:hypothetical protein
VFFTANRLGRPFNRPSRKPVLAKNQDYSRRALDVAHPLP